MDRIVGLKISNVRTIKALEMSIDPVNVLIGENGAGKSTIIEVLELLRTMAQPGFMPGFYSNHRGVNGLLRRGEGELGFTLSFELDGIEGTYSTSISAENSSFSERLGWGSRSNLDLGFFTEHSELNRWLNGWSSTYLTQRSSLEDLALHSHFDDPKLRDIVVRVRALMAGIEVHLGFDTLAGWAAQATQRPSPMRQSAILQPAQRLSLQGRNLANTWHQLKNQRPEDDWRHTLELLRLGLGEGIGGVDIVPDAGGGQVSIALRMHGWEQPIPAANLSDGQLAWMAFVAMVKLNPKRSLLAIDEPELHLHPALLGRVVELLTSEQQAPVILSTHSDRILELLDDPVSAVKVCSLEPGGEMALSVLDKDELPKWLERFQDLGRLRASGYLSRVLRKVEPSKPSPMMSSHQQEQP